MGAKEKDKQLDHTICLNKTHANAWVFLFGSQLRAAGPKTNNSSFWFYAGVAKLVMRRNGSSVLHPDTEQL